MLKDGFISLDDKPILKDGYQKYIRCFNILTNSRNCSNGINPISFEALKDYIELYGIENFDSFIYIIQSMDRKWLELMRIELEKREILEAGKSGRRN